MFEPGGRLSTRARTRRALGTPGIIALFALCGAGPSGAQGGSPCAPIAAGTGEVSFAEGFGTELEPAVALFADGTGIVVFHSDQPPGNDNSRNGIGGVFVDQQGLPTGSPFQINTWTNEDQFNAAVASASDGRFVVVWESDTSPGDVDGQSIRGRLYDANGQPRGDDFQINDHVAGDQRFPQVGMADDGSFVVVWQSEQSPGNDQSGSSVQARRFDANGNPRGAQFQVNSLTNSTQDDPDVGVAPDGRFVVVFASTASAGGDNSSASVQMRRYGADGQPLGAEQQVNVTTQSAQDRPRVAVDADGSYLVVWQSASSAGTDGDGRSVQARGFLSTGIAAGNEVQVNERTAGHDDLPDVAPVGGREFLVVWTSPVPGVTQPEAAARASTLEGQFLGIEYSVSQSVSFVAVGGNRNGASLVASRAIARVGGIVGRGYSHPCATGEGVAECTAGPTTLCLNSDRFRVTLTWRDAQGMQGSGQAFELTPDTGYFWFFDPANVEVVVKLLNACGFNQRYWAFVAGLTDVEIDLLIEDTNTSTVRRYGNPLGSPFQPVTDTDAFATCP